MFNGYHAGKAVPFPFVKLDDKEWSTRGPSAFPEMTEGAMTRNPLYGDGIHDRNPNPEINKERMQQFRDDLQRAEVFDDLKHPKPWERRQGPAESSGLNLKLVRVHRPYSACNISCMQQAAGPTRSIACMHASLYGSLHADACREQYPRHACSYTCMHTGMPCVHRDAIAHADCDACMQDGSNGWAVSGKFTKSGMPILAGDPHVEVNAPGKGLGFRV